MATREPTYQFAATARECELIRAIRAVENSITPIKQTRLYQTLELSVKDEDGDSLGSCLISPEDIMMEFLRAGVGFYQGMMKEHVQQSERSTEVDEGVHIEDDESVSGSQTQEVPEDSTEQEDEEKTISWDTIKESIIPSSVKEVTFTLDDDHSTLSHKEELQSQFPGVVIAIPSEGTQKEQTPKNQELEKPKGVKQMIIRLDEIELAQDPSLEDFMRKIYPWASIELKVGPNTSKKCRRVAEPNPISSHKADPIKHIQDLADYVSEPPDEGEFSYKCPLFESWGTLPFQIKLEIAHARAIQNHHGKVADGNGCSHCVSQGRLCKVYPTQLANLTHISFGHSCQNCRLQRLQCDLPAAGKDRRPSAATAPAALRVDTNSPVPPPAANATPRSLASRMTLSDGTRLGGKEDTSGTRGGAIQFRTPTSANANGSLVDFAHELGITIPIKAIPVIYSMYKLLRYSRQVTPHGVHGGTLQQYYENLVTLYILTYKRKEYDLAYIILLRFQNTNHTKAEELPNEANVVRASEHLPTASPMNPLDHDLIRFSLGQRESGELRRVHEQSSRTERKDSCIHQNALRDLTHSR